MQTFPVADHITRLKAYVPGKPIAQVQQELGLTEVIKLASNENPLGPSPTAVAAFTAAAQGLEIYPEGNAPALRHAVAELVEMPEETLVFGNGSDEVLHMIAMTFLQPGDQSVQADPSFAMYEIYATQANAEIIKVPLKNYTHDLPAMAAAITPRTRVVFIANPNNPTGTLVTKGEIERFLDQVPSDVIVVFDEAYDEYVTETDKADIRPYIRAGRNVMILRTFSKAYGLAGLRVGYGIARPEIADILNKVRSPFNVNLAAQAAAAAAAGDQAHIRQSVTLNTQGREYFTRTFTEMGLEYVPSQANFVLVNVARDSRVVFDALLRKGVIVRPGAGLGLPQHIRVSVGTTEQNEKFIAALAEVLETIPPQSA